jgi:hypothetical protein
MADEYVRREKHNTHVGILKRCIAAYLGKV